MILSVICFALLQVALVEGTNPNAMALAPSYNEHLIHQINAARQMAVNKLAASLGTGTGTAHVDGVPGARFSNRLFSGSQKPLYRIPHNNAPSSQPAPQHRQVSPTAGYGAAPPAHLQPGLPPPPVYPTSPVYTPHHPQGSYALPPPQYNVQHAPGIYQGPALFAAYKAPQAQIYPSGAAYTGESQNPRYPTSNGHGYLRLYQEQPARPRPHGKSASSMLGSFGFDSEPFFFNDRAKLFGYDNSIQEHYIKTMSRHNKILGSTFNTEKNHYDNTPRVTPKESTSRNDFDEPKFDKPKFEEPKFEEPKYAEPKFEEPKYAEPKFGELKYDEPKFEEPKYAQPKFGEPKYDESKFEQPKYAQPKFGEPKYDEPKFEEPKYAQPKFGKQKYTEPKFEEPKYEEPKPSYELPPKALVPPQKSYRVPEKTYSTIYKHIHGGGRRGPPYLQMHAFVPVAIRGYGRY